MLYPETSFQSPLRYLCVKEYGNPFLVIDSFFSEYHPVEATRLLHKWFRSVFAEKSRLNKADALELLYFNKQLARLLEAAWLLKDEGDDPQKGRLPSGADGAALLSPELAHLANKLFTEWDCFPRHLSRKEYANPYRVFRKCFQRHDLTDWHELLEDLFYAAGTDGPLANCVQADDLYFIQRCLFKLIEAGSLLKVRETTPFIDEDPATV